MVLLAKTGEKNECAVLADVTDNKHTRSSGLKSRNVLDQQGGREGPLEIKVL